MLATRPHSLLDSADIDAPLCSTDMAWSVPQYSRSQVDKAGEVLVRWRKGDPGSYYDLDDALAVINNWRSSHSFPLNTFQVGLRRRAKRIDHNCLVAQRIKRLSSIESKLILQKGMQLSRMQDIGGCRAVLDSVGSVDKLVKSYKESDIKHKLSRENDYIRNPKISGYRGIHLVYRYNSDRNQTYNNLQIEMQFRSQLQHAWATAVETVGTFIHQALKSSQGEEAWLRFFALMGTAIANREKGPPVPDTPTNKAELVKELKHYARSLDVERRLRAYGAALSAPEDVARNSHYFLLTLDPAAQRVTIQGFRVNELERASVEYLRTERAIAPGSDAVLVSVESLAALRRAYPNYFLDTRAFIEAVRFAIS